MSTLPRSLVLALALFSAASAPVSTASAQTPSRATNRLAFLHASVIPMDKERVLRDYTVVVANGKIVDIGASAAVKVPSDAVRIDATGRYLIPALSDMHVHLLCEAWKIVLPPDAQPAIKDLPFESLLFPYVAMGVTTVQALSATPEEVTLRGRINRGELIGPRLILARMIDGPKMAWPPPLSTWVATPAEAREGVRQAKAAGYDKIKVYSFLTRESYDAIVTTARELGMDVIGHVPNAISVEYTLDAGQRNIVHSEEVMKQAHGNYTAARIDSFADLMARRGVWMTPTLVTNRNILEIFDAPDNLPVNPEDVYFRHPLETGVWSFLVEQRYKPIPEEMRKKLRDGFTNFQQPLTKAFRDKGGRLLAGSDTPVPRLVPGFALHRELRELVEAGLTPYEALRTSTTNPFEYLGESDKAGTIGVGKQTDLLLVDANPLEDITAAAKISGVLMRGRWLDKAEIGRKMQAISALPK